MPEIGLEQSTEYIVVVWHQRGSCFVVGEQVFGVVALDMQGWCLGEYKANSSELCREGWCV